MLLYGQDAYVANWCASQLKLKPFAEGLYVAVGILHEGRLIGGVVWNNYYTDSKDNALSIEVTLATIDKRWATRHNISQLFLYPFIQLNVKRVQATCGRKAKRVRSTLLRLGFKFEGIIRQGSPLGGDAALYSMLKHECVWIKHGQVNSVSARSAGSSSNSKCADRV